MSAWILNLATNSAVAASGDSTDNTTVVAENPSVQDPASQYQNSPYEVVVHHFRTCPSSCRGRALDAYWYVEPDSTYQQFQPKYQLWLGETSTGPWHKVLLEPTEATMVIGIGAKLYSHRPGRYLRLAVLDPQGRLAHLTDPMDPTNGLQRHEFLQYREFVRLENLHLEKVSGFWGYLAKKIITECPCPDCSDEILGGAPDSSCQKCLGTGTIGGYHPAIRLRADWSSTPKSRGGKQKESKVGISEVERRAIKVLPFPIFSYDDVWVDEATGNRYKVLGSDPVNFKVFPIAQVVSISLLPKSDPAYKIPLNDG